jgi:hypothetical protein
MRFGKNAIQIVTRASMNKTSRAKYKKEERKAIDDFAANRLPLL